MSKKKAIILTIFIMSTFLLLLIWWRVGVESDKILSISGIMIAESQVKKGIERDLKNETLPEQVGQICQTDYTTMVYEDGYYYFQSAADHLYLYRMNESDGNSTCLVKQVPKELYIMDEWVYFTNLSEGKTLWRVKKEGGESELVLEQKIKRFVPVGESFYCLTEEGSFYVWDKKQELILLYPGHGWWISTDGTFLYLRVLEGENASMVVSDLEGNIISEYEEHFPIWSIPDNQNIYYLDDKEVIMELSAKSGETIKITEFPYSEGKTIYGFMKTANSFYILCSGKEGDNYTMEIYQYDCLVEEWSAICEKQIMRKELHFYEMIWEMTNVSLVNGSIFFKRPSMDGKGELWYKVVCENGEEVLFEDMEPLSVRLLSHDDMFYGVNKKPGSFQSEDYVCIEEKEDDEGNLIKTEIRVPQFNKQVPAYEIINGHICEDADHFYQERMEFAEDVRETAMEWEGKSVGSWKYWYAFADKNYVCVAYRKFLGQNALDDIKSNEFVVKLYDSETGEELEIMDLFTVDEDKLMLRLGFAIRKTFAGLDSLSSDLGMVGGCYYRIFYILTDGGVDVLLVERVPTKVYHFEIGYDELEDILIKEGDR